MTDRNSKKYGQMNPEAQARLEEIVVKESAAMSQSEKDFLRSRSMYLTDEELDRYQDVLSGDEVEIVERKAEVQAEVAQEEQVFDGQPDPFREAEKVLESADADVAELIPYRELQGRAKAVKLRTIGLNHRQLQQKVLELEATQPKEEKKADKPKKK